MDYHRAGSFLDSIADVEGVQAVDKMAAFLGKAFDVDCAGLKINDGRARGAHRGYDGIATQFSNHVDGRCSRGSAMAGVSQPRMPEGAGIGAGAAISIERVNAVGFGSDEDNVVRSFIGNRQLGRIQRLRIDKTVDNLREQFSELS